MKRYGCGPTTLYRLYDAEGALLYVGITDNVTGRFTQHACEKLWWDDLATIRLEHYAMRHEALAAETIAIETEHPRHNLAGVHPDDRHPRYRGWVLPRGECSVCGSNQAVSTYGRIFRHKAATYREDGTIAKYGVCSGTARKPREAVA